MAKADTTKRKIADAMKRLMEQKPMAKIRVDDICRLCRLNRNTFYYHFQDKYDLVNWIFQTEATKIVKNCGQAKEWDLLESLYRYFYNSKRFYRNVLSDDESTIFLEQLRSFVKPYAEKIIYGLGDMKYEEQTFLMYSLTDSFLTSLRRWLISYPHMTAEAYFSLLYQEWTAISFGRDQL